MKFVKKKNFAKNISSYGLLPIIYSYRPTLQRGIFKYKIGILFLIYGWIAEPINQSESGICVITDV